MIRLRYIQTFQPVKAGKSKVPMNLFTDDLSIPIYQDRVCQSWILLDEANGVVYIEEMTRYPGIDPYHVISVNNLQSAKPYPDYVTHIFDEFVHSKEATPKVVGEMPPFYFPGVTKPVATTTTTVDQIVPKKKKGRPRKEVPLEASGL